MELEAIDLINAKKDSESARELQRLEFEANQEIDALARLEKLRENLNEEELIETERLTNQINRYKVGTQARQDAVSFQIAIKKFNYIMLDWELVLGFYPDFLNRQT